MPTNPSKRFADIAWGIMRSGDRVFDLQTLVWGLFGNRRPDGKPALTAAELEAPIETFIGHQVLAFTRTVLTPSMPPTPPPPAGPSSKKAKPGGKHT
jgi:hypothetical protein